MGLRDNQANRQSGETTQQWRDRISSYSGDWWNFDQDKLNAQIARADDAIQKEKSDKKAEDLQATQGVNAQNALQAQLEALNRQRGENSYGMQQQRAQAMGGSAGYDMNGDGTIGEGETMTIDPRQSMAGRFDTAQAGKLNRSGLANSTLGAGAGAAYSKNLNDQLFQLQASQEQKAAQGQSDLAAQMATLGNQAGKTYKIVDGKVVMA
jgi:hypothetical protein